MTKKLYKIKDLVNLLGITPRTIRYYDQFGLLVHVKRTAGGMRLFDDEDIEIIKKIRRMQKEDSLPLDIIKEKLFGKKKLQNEKNIIVVSDSTAAISENDQKDLNIKIIPLHIQLNEEKIPETAITAQEFFEKTNNLDLKVTTIPPTEEDFIKQYLALYEKGYKEIYSIHITSSVSNTYNNALQAAYKVADRINVYVIDSKNIGPGHRALVIEIAEAIKNNQSKEEIEVLIQKTVPLITVLAMSNTVKHLFNKLNVNYFPQTVKNLIVKLFAFKPVLEMKNASGEFVINSWCKDKNEAIKIILDSLEKEVEKRGGYTQKIFIDYNYLYGEAIDTINQIKTMFPHVKIQMQEGSAVLSSYLGPETLGIAII